MNIVLIYPHQLFEENKLLDNINKTQDLVFLVQDSLYFTQYNFHKIKIEFHTRSMNFYKKFLEDKNYKVKIVKSLEGIFDYIKDNNLNSNSNNNKLEKAFLYDVVDDYLDKKIRKTLEQNNVELIVCESPMFLTDNSEIDEYVSTQSTHDKTYFMRNFYVWQRKRLNILLDENKKPLGGKWSYDEDNRKKIPKDIEIPKISKLVENFKDNLRDDFIYATNFVDAKICLANFLKEKLNNFGPYEDAVMADENFLFHSVLSPYLNSGLLTPDYVIKETLKYYEHNKKDVLLQSVEGFIRQIIGWREYMRLVYIKLGGKIRTKNYFNAERKIPQSFWTGDTGVLPIDNSIFKIKETAYDHHIPRLMIMGNFMNLCGFHPNEVYKWFMENFIDAYDWVMVANVYSMALYADGGLITTKPYIAGSNYVLKMSDFKKGKLADEKSWDKIWDALFWTFVGNHYEKLASKGRLGFIGITYKKISPEKIENYKKLTFNFLKDLEE